MNIPVGLYEYMLRIPPHKITYLSDEQLQQFGLSEDDPYEDAASTARMAKSLGISTDEYIRRWAKLRTECGSIQDSGESSRCVQRVLYEGK